MDGHRDTWQAHMFRGIFQLIYQQVSLLVPAISDLSGERTWSGFDKYLVYGGEVPMKTVGKAGHFGIRKRIFLFLKCCMVQIRDLVSFWGPKAFSFGRCDQELKTKCRKMVKNEGA